MSFIQDYQRRFDVIRQPPQERLNTRDRDHTVDFLSRALRSNDIGRDTDLLKGRDYLVDEFDTMHQYQDPA
jgi:hypothetical protein